MRIPTGISGIDTLLEGGIPIGCITELVGEPSTGKSYLALRTIAAAQAQGKTCLLIDTECSYDARWAQRHGVEISSLIVAQPTFFEQAEAIITEAITSKCCDLLIIDSLDALVSRLSGTAFSQSVNPYEASKVLFALIPKLHTLLEIFGTTCLIISQYRQRGASFQSLANGLMREHADVRALLTASDPSEFASSSECESSRSQRFTFTLKRNNITRTLSSATFRIE